MTFATHTGNRGLVLEEKLIFEQGQPGRTGVDLPEPKGTKSRLGGLDRDSNVGLPGLSEPQGVRPACLRKTSVLIPASSRWDPAP